MSFLGRVSSRYHVLKRNILSVWDLLAIDNPLIPSLLSPLQLISEKERDTVSSAALNYPTSAKSRLNTAPPSLGAAPSRRYFFKPCFKFSIWLPQREAAFSSEELGLLNISQAMSRIADDVLFASHL